SMEVVGESVDRIELQETDDGCLRIDDLCVAAPEDGVSLSEAHVELKPSERALIVAEDAAGSALLLQALIGIWPWGRGRITRPARHSTMFLPRRTYLPPGTLRAALAYPHAADEYEPAAFDSALAAVGLQHLLPHLDTVDRWSRRLSEGDKQNLTFARV